MSKFRSTPTQRPALVASFDRDGAAYETPNPDCRPMRHGKKSDLFSRTRAPKAEVLEAERLIRAQRAAALIADFGPNERVRDIVGTL